MKKLRVIVMGTGFVGHLALRAVIDHPQLDLAGVWVHSPGKVGLDASELAGYAESTGILATNDLEALTALGADCLCCFAEGNQNDDWVADTACRFLDVGTNVVTSSVAGLIHPRTYYRQDLVERLQAAAINGNASFLASGMDPGLSSDFAINLTQACHYWSRILVQENYDYSTYLPNGAAQLFRHGLGFGMPLDYEAQLFQKGALTVTWGGPTIALIADALGQKIDEVREVHWRCAAKESFEIPQLGLIEQGTMEAFRFQAQGLVDGKPAIIAEHITRLRKGSAPEWSSGYAGEGYYVEIDGDPDIRAHYSFTGPNGDHQYGAIMATGMKLVNAVPHVCAAEPGMLVAPVDLPAARAHAIYRPSST